MSGCGRREALYFKVVTAGVILFLGLEIIPRNVNSWPLKCIFGTAA